MWMFSVFPGLDFHAQPHHSQEGTGGSEEGGDGAVRQPRPGYRVPDDIYSRPHHPVLPTAVRKSEVPLCLKHNRTKHSDVKYLSNRANRSRKAQIYTQICNNFQIFVLLIRFGKHFLGQIENFF